MYPLVEQFDFDAMYNEGASEFIEQGLYYPTATNYGYYCTGFESPSEWEDHYKIFGGAQTENLPFVYYTPSHAYAQSPYNPYNPFIPGAVIGVDGPYGGAQQYYSIPSFQDTVSSPACGSVVIPPDMISSSFPDPLLNTGASITNRTDGRGLKNSVASASAAYPSNPSKPSLIQKHSFTKFSEGPRAKANIGPNNHSVIIRSVSSGSSTAAPSLVLQGRTSSGSTQPLDDISSGKVLPPPNQVKAVVSNGNGFSDFQSSARGRSAVDKLLPKTAVGQPLNTMGRNPDMCMFTEQNRGPRTSRSKDQLAVKAYTSKAGVTDAEGNIIICTEHYNEEDFQVDYVDAKFFVIKSYSEDDVHKSIKYGVWSSTSHGNKKLQSAYEDAQKLAAGKPGGCPIFLFFSVNASSQFCGVAEMIGPVDFYKDMDFWQQDKWSGSFPVKWHIIKDVPNTSLRHIILRNNENKPVTNSRDTQEIMHTEGLEMLKIFKNHPRDTSLFDDFMYYEKRQKFMQEERARLVFKSFQRPFFSPALGLADKLNRVVQLPLKEEDKINTTEKSSSNSDISNSSSGNGNADRVVVEAKDDIKSTLLSLNPKPAESKPLAEATDIANSEMGNVFTVGSMPIKLNGLSESSSVLKVGAIPLDPKSLQLDKGGAFPKISSQNQY
ncbi:YTH domain-containing protein [Citrus sinensis]|nr:YTH domain-containing protein [Citrus sinensis]